VNWASFSMIGLAESCSTLLLPDKLLNGLEVGGIQ